MNVLDAVKVKKKLKVWQVIIIVAASILVASILIFVIDDFVYSRAEVRYHQTGFARAELASYSSRTVKIDSRSYFDNLGLAIEATFSGGREAWRTGEIIKFEHGNIRLIFFSDFMERPLFKSAIPIIWFYVFEERNDGKVYLTHFWVQKIEAIMLEPRRKLFDEDRVARDIVLAYIHRDITAVANGDVPIYLSDVR